MSRGSIRFRLVLVVALVVTLFYGCFGVYLYAGFRSYLIHALRETLARRAHQIASTIVSSIPQRGEAYVAKEVQARFAPELNERLIRILDGNGRAIYASSNVGGVPPIPAPAMAAAQVEGAPSAQEIAGQDGKNYQMVVVTYQIPVGRYQVEVGAPENQVALELRGLILMLALGFLSSFF